MSNINFDEFLEELNIFLKRDDKNYKNNNLIKEELTDIKTDEIGNDINKLIDIEFNDIIEDTISIKELDSSDKPREKLYKFGADKLLDYELLAILLGSGSKKYDVMNLSKKLWKFLYKYKRIGDVTLNDLMNIEGIGLSKASTIIAALELSKRINIRESVDDFNVNSPKSVADIFMNILKDELQEHFYVLLLDTKNKIISWNEISRGDLNSSIVHPREVFKYAIKRSANSIICLHNHPSGDPTPSKQDIDITERLQKAGNIVGVNVLDHIIIGYNKYVSLREYGIMK